MPNIGVGIECKCKKSMNDFKAHFKYGEIYWVTKLESRYLVYFSDNVNDFVSMCFSDFNDNFELF